MAHGSEDWKASKPTATIYGVDDLGELAVRLGSPVSFDRRGNVIWFDDFESGVHKWLEDITGTGSAVVASAEAARNGAISAKLTTGNAIGNHAEIDHWLYFPAISKVGLEVSWTFVFQMSELIFTQALYGNGYYHLGELRYVPSTFKLQYRDENDDWQDLATLSELAGATYIFHTIKFVMDLSTRKYVRALLDDTEYDMSALSYYSSASAVTLAWWQAIKVITGAASNLDAYIDDVIVTQNEP